MRRVKRGQVVLLCMTNQCVYSTRAAYWLLGSLLEAGTVSRLTNTLGKKEKKKKKEDFRYGAGLKQKLSTWWSNLLWGCLINQNIWEVTVNFCSAQFYVSKRERGLPDKKVLSLRWKACNEVLEGECLPVGVLDSTMCVWNVGFVRDMDKTTMVYILIRKLSLFFSSKVPDIYKVACEKLQYSRMFRSAFLGYLREGFFFFFFRRSWRVAFSMFPEAKRILLLPV